MTAADTTAGRTAQEPDFAVIEIRYRPESHVQGQAFAGHDAAFVAAEVAVALGVRPDRLTALNDDPPKPRRCWITRAPDGQRLARVGGLEAADLNLALAGLDAGQFQRIAS